MTGRVFLDTNILVYALAAGADGAGARRTQVAEQLLAAGGVVSVQVLNEFVDVVTRRLNFAWDDVDRGLQAVNVLCGRVMPLTSETQATAVRLSQRYRFRIYDSQIVASALEAGCTALYTEDLQDLQEVEGLMIENPFRRSRGPRHSAD